MRKLICLVVANAAVLEDPAAAARQAAGLRDPLLAGLLQVLDSSTADDEMQVQVIYLDAEVDLDREEENVAEINEVEANVTEANVDDEGADGVDI